MKTAEHLTECLVCGSRRVRRVITSFKVEAKGRRITIPRVPRERCADCGEEFFGPEANAILDKYRGRPQTRRSAIG